MLTICDELRQAVLQAAIQGKLTEQLPEDGNAEDLLKAIQEEKQKLIAEKKIKKEKPLEPISEDKIPFDIPENWRWVRFADVIDVRDGTHDTPKYVTDGVPLVTSKSLANGEIEFGTTKLISYEDAQQINMRSAVDNGDILFAMIGTIGNPVLVKKDREFCIKNMALFKAISQALFNMNYLLLFLRNEQDAMKKQANGGVQSFVSLKFLRNYLFPLPPLEEQKRIVARAEALIAEIDALEKTEQELLTLKKAFLGDLKASLLQAAMQGKLTKQLPEDGNAEDLLKTIQEEKRKLIAEKKIKKEKPLEPISEEEILFDIPENWRSTKVGNALMLFDGPKCSNCCLPLLDAKFLRGKSDPSIVTSGRYVKSGDYLILVDGENSGEVFIAPVDGFQGSTFKLLYIPFAMNASFVQYFFDLHSDLLKNNKRGAAIPHLDKEVFANLLLPIPPLAEQQRIVEKLDQLLPLCDGLAELV